MKAFILASIFLALTTPPGHTGSNAPFSNTSLPHDWTWKRENKEAWRLRDNGLEIRIEPGNMWGGENNARNVLLVPVPPNLIETGADVQANFENSPTKRWEQVDLVWYYLDSHMVKIGLELEHGKNSVVMGREEEDKTRTINIVPLEQDRVTVRFTVADGIVKGYFRLQDNETWTEVGSCEEPRPADPSIPPHYSIQCYQGDPDNPKWARITNLVITPMSAQP